MAFAGVAFVLALVGVHGLLSYGVVRALTVAGGAVTGLVGAFLLSRTIESVVFGIEPGDPLTAAVVLCFVLAAGAVAPSSPCEGPCWSIPMSLSRVGRTVTMSNWVLLRSGPRNHQRVITFVDTMSPWSSSSSSARSATRWG